MKRFVIPVLVAISLSSFGASVANADICDDKAGPPMLRAVGIDANGTIWGTPVKTLYYVCSGGSAVVSEYDMEKALALFERLKTAGALADETGFIKQCPVYKEVKSGACIPWQGSERHCYKQVLTGYRNCRN